MKLKLKLNNKGYMLVEIILAFSIAMGITYFITDLTIKLKNKNDDLVVKTLVSTDRGIIYNTIMKDLYNTEGEINCEYIEGKMSIDTDNNIFKYNEFVNIVNEYTELKYTPDDEEYCSYNDGTIKIKIDLDVPQLKENFDVNIEYSKK